MADAPFSYRVLLDYFGQDVITERFEFLYAKMTDFMEESGLEKKVYICEGKLDHAVIDYFTDIYRLKTFHNIEHVNRQKIYAYLVFWIIRRQPLQVLPEFANEEKCLFVNENFATSLLGYYFTTPSRRSDEMYDARLVPSSGEARFAMDELQAHVRYHLMYRLVDARNLELLLSAYEAGYRIGKFNTEFEEV